MIDDDEDRQDEEQKSPDQVENEEAEQEVKALEEDPPQNLEDWPEGKAMYKTLGGAEGGSSYEDGPTANLGKSDVRHHEDGSVTVGGEKVDDPDEYKGDPIPGGPTDPNAPKVSGERDLSDDGEEKEEEEDDDKD